MGPTSDSNSGYHEVNGVKVHQHKAANNASFVKACCGYDPGKTSLRDLTSNEKGELSEHAAVKYAEAQGYENIRPKEGDIDPSDKGVDVVAFDPVTREQVVIEAKTQKRSAAWDAKNRKGPWNSDRLDNTVEDRALDVLEEKGDRQLDPEYITRDSKEKLSEVDPDDEPGSDAARDLHPRTREGVEQSYGEAVGYRGEFVGIQIGEIEGEGPPIEGNFGDPDVNVDRATIVQIPEAEHEHSLREDPHATDVDPAEAFGAKNEQYRFSEEEIAERRDIELSDEERERYERFLEANDMSPTEEDSVVNRSNEGLQSMNEGIDGDATRDRGRNR